MTIRYLTAGEAARTREEQPMADKAQMINVRVGPVTKAQQGAITILTPEERRTVLLAAARAKALGVATDALPAPSEAATGRLAEQERG